MKKILFALLFSLLMATSISAQLLDFSNYSENLPYLVEYAPAYFVCDGTVTNISLQSAKTIAGVDYSTSGCLSNDVTANWFKFTPSETTRYTTWSTGALSTKLTIMNSSQTVIATITSGGLNQNFKHTLNLEAGKTYYLKVELASLTSTGLFYLKMDKLAWPSISKYITQNWSTTHGAVDIGAADKTNVYSFASGNLDICSYRDDPINNARMGNYCIVLHEYNPQNINYNYLHSRYLHLSSIISNARRRVLSGEILGKTGGTPWTDEAKTQYLYASHLHFGIQYYNTYEAASDRTFRPNQSYNPLSYFPDVSPAMFMVIDIGEEKIISRSDDLLALKSSGINNEFDIFWLSEATEEELIKIGITSKNLLKFNESIPNLPGYIELKEILVKRIESLKEQEQVE